jgi:hypothetical protein
MKTLADFPETAKYVILSPDEIPISPEPFKSKTEAETYLKEWIKRFSRQGYYSTPNGHIPIDVLYAYCPVYLVPKGKTWHGSINWFCFNF